MRVRWTEKSVRRLEEIALHIAEDNVSAALKLVERLKTAAASLATTPRLGRRVPERFDDSIRELLVGNYRLIYRVSDTEVAIMTIFEGHRLLPSDE